MAMRSWLWAACLSCEFATSAQGGSGPPCPNADTGLLVQVIEAVSWVGASPACGSMSNVFQNLHGRRVPSASALDNHGHKLHSVASTSGGHMPWQPPPLADWLEPRSPAAVVLLQQSQVQQEPRPTPEGKYQLVAGLSCWCHEATVAAADPVSPSQGGAPIVQPITTCSAHPCVVVLHVQDPIATGAPSILVCTRNAQTSA